MLDLQTHIGKSYSFLHVTAKIINFGSYIYFKKILESGGAHKSETIMIKIFPMERLTSLR